MFRFVLFWFCVVYERFVSMHFSHSLISIVWICECVCVCLCICALLFVCFFVELFLHFVSYDDTKHQKYFRHFKWNFTFNFIQLNRIEWNSGNRIQKNNKKVRNYWKHNLFCGSECVSGVKLEVITFYCYCWTFWPTRDKCELNWKFFVCISFLSWKIWTQSTTWNNISRILSD